MSPEALDNHIRDALQHRAMTLPQLQECIDVDARLILKRIHALSNDLIAHREDGEMFYSLRASVQVPTRDESIPEASHVPASGNQKKVVKAVKKRAVQRTAEDSIDVPGLGQMMVHKTNAMTSIQVCPMMVRPEIRLVSMNNGETLILQSFTPGKEKEEVDEVSFPSDLARGLIIALERLIHQR